MIAWHDRICRQPCNSRVWAIQHTRQLAVPSRATRASAGRTEVRKRRTLAQLQGLVLGETIIGDGNTGRLLRRQLTLALYTVPQLAVDLAAAAGTCHVVCLGE